MLGAVLRSTRLTTIAPGALVFLVLWIVTFSRFDFAADVNYTIDWSWQSLGRDALMSDPLASLAVLHIQPPGMNVLFALDLAITPDRHLFLALAFLAMVIATIAFIVDALLRLGLPAPGAAIAGVLYAVLPSTVIYSLWAYSIPLIALLSVLALWSLTWLNSRPMLSAFTSTFAMLLLVLTRPSFSWPILVLWAVAVSAVAWRRVTGKRWRVAVVALPVLVGLLVQLHYFLSFGLPVMSSWSGENLAKALRTSQALTITESAREQVREDLCRGAMLRAYEEQRLNWWDDVAFRGLPECSVSPALESTGVAAWDSPVKAASPFPNHNYADRLVASREWTQMMTIIVREDPWQLARMAFTSEYGPRSSSLGLYLSPAEDYPFTKQIRDATPLAVPLGLLSIMYAPGAWLLMLLGVGHAIATRTSSLRSNTVFWFALALSTFHMAVNTLVEYGENMRFRAEIDGVLMLGASLALWAIWRDAGKDSEPTRTRL